MSRDSSPDQADMLARFAQRFRDEVSFHDLARRDMRAALTQAGIAVPPGVSVRYAANISGALSAALDHAAPAGAGAAAVIDDEALQDVTGGTGATVDAAQIQRFLGVLIRRPA